MKSKFDNLTAEQVGKLFPIRIVPYNPDWKNIYEQEKELINGVLGDDIMLNIEHFGSTSVEGLAAKPTIDILVEVSKLTDELKQAVSQKLGTIGYGNMDNAEKENQMTFGKGYDEHDVCSQTYHVHIREKGNYPHDEIYFRDYLRQNEDDRDRYAKLKYTLVEKYKFNREEYTNGKTDFIVQITEKQKERQKNALPE